MTSHAEVAQTLTVRAQIAAAARANLAPGLLLQAAAALLVTAYYFWPAARASFDAVAAFKASIGYPYSFVALAFFAGILPQLLQRLQRNAVRESVAVWPFYALLWGTLGVIFDAFYKLQAAIFGQGTDLWTIVQKVALDLLVFTPSFALPVVFLSFVWKDNGFDAMRTRLALGKGWYRERVWPMLLACWMVWVPAVAMIYALPLALQFPIQNIIECLWVLILLFMTRPDGT